MTLPAMHPSEAVAPHSARGQKSSLLNQAVAASVHGGFPLMSPAPIQATVVEDDALTSGAHIHSSSSQDSTSAALSVHLAISAATAALAHSEESFSLSDRMNSFLRHGATQRHSTSLLSVECIHEPTRFPL